MRNFIKNCLNEVQNTVSPLFSFILIQEFVLECKKLVALNPPPASSCIAKAYIITKACLRHCVNLSDAADAN